MLHHFDVMKIILPNFKIKVLTSNEEASCFVMEGCQLKWSGAGGVALSVASSPLCFPGAEKALSTTGDVKDGLNPEVKFTVTNC